MRPCLWLVIQIAGNRCLSVGPGTIENVAARPDFDLRGSRSSADAGSWAARTMGGRGPAIPTPWRQIAAFFAGFVSAQPSQGARF